MKRLFQKTCTTLKFSFLLFALQSAHGSVDAQKDSLALLHYKRGETFIHQGDTASAILEFKQAIYLNRKLSPAYHRLAQLHLGLGSLDDRVEARHALDQALRFEPDNVDYLYTFLELYLRIDAAGFARQILNKLLKINPRDARAYYYLGYLEEKEWFKYRDMFNPQDNGIFFSLGGFAEEDLDKAEDYYLKAVRLNPLLSDAYYRLALLYYETDALPRIISSIKDALNVDPDNKDYHLFLGLAYHRMRRFEEALKEYEYARSLMQPDEIAFYESIDLISTPEQNAIYLHAGVEEKKDIHDSFWKRRDPLFLTEMNERKLEHYSRIAYANLRFSDPGRGIEGWKTDRGKVLIRYGPPDYQYKTRATINASMAGIPGAPGIFPVNFSKSVWSYPDFEFVFEDRSFNQNYSFKWGVEGTDYLHVFNRMIRTEPDRYDFIHPKSRFELSCSYARFLDNNGSTVLEVYHGFPEKTISTTGNKKKTNLKRGVFLFDPDWKEVRKNVTEGPHLTQYNDTLLLGWDRIQVTPGAYHLIVEFLDEGKDKIGRWSGQLSVEPINRLRLSISDVVLAWEIGKFRTEEELRRGGVRIVPNTLGTYPLASTIPLYFEIYNLTYSFNGKTHYRVTFTVGSGDEKGKLSRLINGLFGKERSPGRVTTSYEYSGSRSNETVYQNLSLEQPRHGDYHLSVEIIDLNTGEKVGRKKVFVLQAPERD